MKTTKHPRSDEDSQGVLEDTHIRFLVDASVSDLRDAVSGHSINIAKIDGTVAEQHLRIAEQDGFIAEQGVRIDNLVSTVSDMSTELKPLRLRHLIEEGRKYFWKKYGLFLKFLPTLRAFGLLETIWQPILCFSLNYLHFLTISFKGHVQKGDIIALASNCHLKGSTNRVYDSSESFIYQRFYNHC